LQEARDEAIFHEQYMQKQLSEKDAKLSEQSAQLSEQQNLIGQLQAEIKRLKDNNK